MLLASVGENGGNQTVEVKIVQMLLNDWLGNNRLTLLKVDGIAGPLTIGAIRAYQKAQGITADGRADLAGPTIISLVRRHLTTMRTSIEKTACGRQLLSTPMPMQPSSLKTRPAEEGPELSYIASLRAILAQ
jgi:peptidoglycan hydrolase-like protein with peptidoglycan-binding domain